MMTQREVAIDIQTRPKRVKDIYAELGFGVRLEEVEIGIVDDALSSMNQATKKSIDFI